MGDQLEHLEKAQALIERGPIAFYAAVVTLAVFGAVYLWVRAVLRVEKLQRLHAKEFAQLQADHAQRVDGMRMEQIERAVKLEHLLQGVLRMVEVGTIEVRRGRGRRKPTTNPGLAMEQEAPTQILDEGPDDE